MDTGLTTIQVQSEAWRRRGENDRNESARVDNAVPVPNRTLRSFEVGTTSPNDTETSFTKSMSSPSGELYGTVLTLEYFSTTASDDMGRTQFYHLAGESPSLVYPAEPYRAFDSQRSLDIQDFYSYGLPTSNFSRSADLSVLRHDSSSTSPSFSNIYGFPPSRPTSYSPEDSFWILHSSDRPSSFLNSYSFSPSDEAQRISPRTNLTFTSPENFVLPSSSSYSRTPYPPLRHSPNSRGGPSGLATNPPVSMSNTSLSSMNSSIPVYPPSSTLSTNLSSSSPPHTSLRDLTSAGEYIPPSITPIQTMKQSSETDAKKSTDLCMEEAGETAGNGNPNGGQRRGGRRKNGRVTDSNSQLLVIDPEKVRTDPRTTLMIRNIPNR